MMKTKQSSLKIGWAQTDITPNRPVILGGYWHARVTKEVLDPVTATALAIESTPGKGEKNYAVMVSCDLVYISRELCDSVRTRIRSELKSFDPQHVFISATHTHTAPDIVNTPAGIGATLAAYKTSISKRKDSEAEAKFGQWPWFDLDIMSPADYTEFAADRIAGAIKEAWENRQAAGMAYGKGDAVVCRNRRMTYSDGTTKLYGDARLPDFRHVEGYEDHSVYAMMTYDRNQKLTGMIVNLPCPAQVTESIRKISADFWHETREELRRRFGKDLFILPQCAPAGDMSPHIMLDRPAEARMLWLRGLVKNLPEKLDSNLGAPEALRQAIALKIADAISNIVPHVERDINWNPEFTHHVELLSLPRRMITEKEVEDALSEVLLFKEEYEKLVKTIHDPEIQKQPGCWWSGFTRAFRKMEQGERVKRKFEVQQENPNVSVEVHAIRLGEIAFATNGFELYLDYAIRIREHSRAVQTFLVQLAGDHMGYLPAERSVAHGGYSTLASDTLVGPDGGERLVDWTVDAINRMWPVPFPERSVNTH